VNINHVASLLILPCYKQWNAHKMYGCHVSYGANRNTHAMFLKSMVSQNVSSNHLHVSLLVINPLWNTYAYIIFFFKQVTIVPIVSILRHIFTNNIHFIKFNIMQVYLSQSFKSKILVSRIESNACLLNNASTTIFPFPFLCLMTYENCSRNSTHLTCLVFDLPCPFKYLRDSWSL